MLPFVISILMLDQLRFVWKLLGVYNHAEKESGMTGKALFTSRIFWANVLLGGLQVADWVGGMHFIPEPYGVAFQSIVNIILRLVTTEPITSVLPGVGPAPKTT